MYVKANLFVFVRFFSSLVVSFNIYILFGWWCFIGRANIRLARMTFLPLFRSIEIARESIPYTFSCALTLTLSLLLCLSNCTFAYTTNE